MEYYPLKRRQKVNEKEETIYSNLAANQQSNYMGIQAKIYTKNNIKWNGELHTYTHNTTQHTF